MAPRRDIPDFSRKAPKKFDGKKAGAPAVKQKTAPNPTEPRIKPRATSGKSGQRGR